MIVYVAKKRNEDLYWDRLNRCFKPLNQHTAFYKNKKSSYLVESDTVEIVPVEIKLLEQ